MAASLAFPLSSSIDSSRMVMGTKEFQWKIRDITKLEEGTLKSERFVAGGCEWMIVAKLRNECGEAEEYLSLFLRCCSDDGAGSYGGRDVYAEYRLVVCNQVWESASLTEGGKRHFAVGGKGWGFKSLIRFSGLLDPRRGFLVDDKVLVRVHVSTVEEIATSLSDVDDETEEEDSHETHHPEGEELEEEKEEEEEEEEEEEGCYSFTWKISDVSKWGADIRKSEKFVAGGCEWILVADTWIDPSEYNSTGYISLFLRCCSDPRAREDGRQDRYAEYEFSVASKLAPHGRYREGGGKRHFRIGGKGWGFKKWIPQGKFGTFELVVDDILVIHAHVSTEPASTPYPGYFAGQVDQEEDLSDDDTDLEDDTLDAADADESDHIEPDDQPNRASIEESMSHERLSGQENAAQEASEEVRITQLSSQQEQSRDQPNSGANKEPRKECLPEQRNAADDDQPSVVSNSATEGPATPLSSQVESPANCTRITNNPNSLPNVRLTARSLGTEISTLTSNMKSSPINGPDNSSFLQQQKEAMVGFLTMSLEAIYQADSFGDVEELALQLADHPTVAVDKTILKDLLTEFKRGASSSMSVIETSHAIEASVVQVSEKMGARLVHRQKQLSSLEGEFSRLAQEEKKLEADIRELIALKDRVSDQKKSAADELGKASQVAAMELEEVKEQSNKRKRASENRLIAEENLAQLNRGWKALKYTLGL